jgi:hypothetical protein
MNETPVPFCALVFAPEKRFSFVRFPTTRMVILEIQTEKDGSKYHELVDLTPRARRVPIGKGPEEITLEAFQAAVYDLEFKKNQTNHYKPIGY